MGERIERLHVRAFRGVPDRLSIELSGGRSLVVFGDNGTGKSTIADAIEWYFSGRVDYLMKENRKEGLRNAASRLELGTEVAVETTGELGGAVALDEAPPSRTLSLAAQEYYLLRGRDLARFVDLTKGQKWGALAGFLGFGEVESFRADLFTARSGLRGAHDGAVRELKERSKAIAGAKVATVSEESVLSRFAALCTESGIRPPQSFEEGLDDDWRQENLSELGSTARHGSIRAVGTELHALDLSLATDAVSRWNNYVRSDDAVGEPRIMMLRAAGQVLDRTVDGNCPLCGQDVDFDSLRERIETTLDDLKEASRRLDEARADIRRLLGQVQRLGQRCLDLRGRLLELEVDVDEPPTFDFEGVERCVRALEHVDLDALVSYMKPLDRWRENLLTSLAELAPPLPDQRATSLSSLIEMIVLARQWRDQSLTVAMATASLDVSERIYSGFEDEQRRQMEAVFELVSKRVADLYGLLHGDEGLEDVAIGPVGSKGVELSIDFHGRTHRPPQRVLSESHMNSLGLALFLAMHDTYNEHLEFLVLDDVVNSFDIEHRGALAKLLCTEYEERQLIVLTHDHQFFTQLARQAPGWVAMEFVGWTYEDGPRTRVAGAEPMLDAARARLEDDDTIGAGQRARRALEEVLLPACSGLEAPLPFRRGARNERREANELLAGVRRGLKDRAPALKSELEPLLRQIESDLQAALNVEAHAGGGRSSRREIEAAIDRIERLASAWMCPTCATPTWLIGGPDAGRCKCGASHFPPAPANGGDE